MTNKKELDFAYKIKHVLNEQADNLPASTIEKLASARKKALSAKKSSTPLHQRVTRHIAAGPVGGFFSEPLSWLGRLSVALPLLTGIAVFIGLYQFEQQQRVNEIAEIDAAVLSDDLPLDAYLDKGFQSFLTKRGDE